MIIDTDECWLYARALHNHGYGEICGNGKVYYAHRVMWENEHKQEIPKGRVIDHLCRVKQCVNPKHLELVTQKVNFDRGERWPK